MSCYASAKHALTVSRPKLAVLGSRGINKNREVQQNSKLSMKRKVEE
jgi:hypothetical protein